jgi:hypothetical protein
MTTMKSAKNLAKYSSVSQSLSHTHTISNKEANYILQGIKDKLFCVQMNFIATFRDSVAFVDPTGFQMFKSFDTFCTILFV